MKMSNFFAFDRRPPVAPGTVRLTRLNIYSALYIEWRQIRVLVDPSYILPEVALELCPDVILVSHESMDHFDVELCLKLLLKREAILIGSWGGDPCARRLPGHQRSSVAADPCGHSRRSISARGPRHPG